MWSVEIEAGRAHPADGKVRERVVDGEDAQRLAGEARAVVLGRSGELKLQGAFARIFDTARHSLTTMSIRSPSCWRHCGLCPSAILTEIRMWPSLPADSGRTKGQSSSPSSSPMFPAFGKKGMERKRVPVSFA